jgi:hypothetical protein
MDKRMLAVVLLPGWLLWSGASTQENPPSDELAVGIRHFDEGDLEAAATTLAAAVRRLENDAGRRMDLARAHLYLAMVRLGLGDPDAARREMAEALRADPDLSLDRRRFPPRVIQLYESVKSTLPPAPTPTPRPQPTPAEAAGQQLGVEHRKVGCLVVGRYPRLDACFSPLAEVAGARLFFRPDTAAQWHYVQMKGEAACHAGVLPRPQGSLAGHKVTYYIEATGRRFATVRTSEYSAAVVSSAGECDADAVAATTSAAGTITVFPNLPAGFAIGGGGIGTVPLLAIIGGGAAAAGVAVAAGGGGGDSPTTTVRSVTTTIPGATPNPGPAPSPSAAPAEALQVTCTAQPREGQRPLTVRFTASAVGGTGSYDYRWQFGDGDSSTERNPSHTYSSPGTYIARVTVNSGSQSRECDRDITVRAAGPSAPPGYLGPGYVRRITWSSDLAVPGARGQVVLNGLSMTYPGEGQAHGVVDLPGPAFTPYATRTVRVEATLVQAAGRPGTWRFDVDAAETYALVEPGSIRVLAGEPLQVGPTSLVYKIRGRPGERVIFTFVVR